MSLTGRDSARYLVAFECLNYVVPGSSESVGISMSPVAYGNINAALISYDLTLNN